MSRCIPVYGFGSRQRRRSPDDNATTHIKRVRNFVDILIHAGGRDNHATVLRNSDRLRRQFQRLYLVRYRIAGVARHLTAGSRFGKPSLGRHGHFPGKFDGWHSDRHGSDHIHHYCAHGADLDQTNYNRRPNKFSFTTHGSIRSRNEANDRIRRHFDSGHPCAHKRALVAGYRAPRVDAAFSRRPHSRCAI